MVVLKILQPCALGNNTEVGKEVTVHTVQTTVVHIVHPVLSQTDIPGYVETVLLQEQ